MWSPSRAYDGHLDSSADSPATSRAPGKRTLTMSLPAPVQRKVAVGGDASPDTIAGAAARGIDTPTGALPHRDTVQAAFGRHRIDHVHAHAGADAAATADEMHAEAYAVGDHIVFGGAMPTLHTVAHEAAHVVQQRAGVARKGGGDMDAFERHADAVADAVVAGRSAEALLDEVAGGGASPAPTVQRVIKVGKKVRKTLKGFREHKGLSKMHKDPKNIYSFDDKDHVLAYIAGTRDAPEPEPNPDFEEEEEEEEEEDRGGKKPKRKGEDDRRKGGPSKKKAKATKDGDGDGDAGGGAEFERDLTLMTNYVQLRINHPGKRYGERVAQGDADGFQVRSLEAIARPPVSDLDTQGQHKVAWRAIWGALARCHERLLPEAHTTMDEIIRLGAKGGAAADETPEVKIAMGHRGPARAHDLVLKAHNYLVARQSDKPSWHSVKAEELKGKGERALGEAMDIWQAFTAETAGDDVREFFGGVKIQKLFDMTGREEKDITDVIGRARTELRVHNPTAFAAHGAIVEEWLAARKAAGKAAKKSE
jgi:hypothetical protein